MTRSALLSVILLVSSFTWAHGGDQPGPHGGKIEMPGPYHVEAVRKDQKTFYIYLLDIEFANPIISNSSVKARILSGKNLDLECKEQIEGLFYICQSPVKLKKSEVLVVESVRNGVKGSEAKFQFK